MAISDVLLEGGITFKKYLHKVEGEWGLRSEDFLGGRHLWMASYHIILLL